MRIQCTCAVCGAAFSRTPSSLPRGGTPYCSHRCHGVSLRTHHALTCTVCGNTYTRRQSSVEAYASTYCSRACHHEARRKQVERTCEHCTRVFAVHLHRPGTGRGRYCSRSCQYAAPRPRAPLADRFWSKVDKRRYCWVWTGRRNQGGYGLVYVAGPWRRGDHLAHRVAWELQHGPIPEGKLICHSCDNPPCVRPEHLWVGSPLENFHDMGLKKRWAKPLTAGGIRTGATHPLAVLTDADILDIRRRYAAGEVSQAALAYEYKVGRSNIKKILRRDTWKHLD